MSDAIYIKPVGGLANRIRVINSGLILAKKNQAKCVVLWERNGDLNATFDSLFEVPSEFQVIELVPGFQWDGMKPTYFPDKKPSGLRSAMFEASKLIYGIGYEVWYDDLKEIFDQIREDYNPEKSSGPQDLTKSVQPKISPLLDSPKISRAYISSSWELGTNEPFIAKFQPTKSIADITNEISLDENCIGIHIRGTDNTWSKEHSALEKFISKMNVALSENDNVKFFIATDEPDCVSQLRDEFGERIIYAPPPQLSRNDPEGIKYALVDMLRLANCGTIYGSYMSSFSDIASKMGNRPLQIVS